MKIINIVSTVLIIALIGIAGVLAWYYGFNNQSIPTPTACTEEAKICPDGSSVGRTGPNCQFTECPQIPLISGWKRVSDTSQNISFQYPENLGTTYISTANWPPTITITHESFSCTPTGFEMSPTGQTAKKIINNATYCVTKQSEGAAGSIYTEYTYILGFIVHSILADAFDYQEKKENIEEEIELTKAYPFVTQKGDNLATVTFTLRFVQCANYPESNKTACEQERNSFDIDLVVSNIVGTIQFAQAVSNNAQGIRGTVLLGPICPVMKNPPDPACQDKLYQTALLVMNKDQSTVITSFQSDSKGNFIVNLPAGEYYITSNNAEKPLPRCSSREAITVSKNTYTDTTVYCDTGIR